MKKIKLFFIRNYNKFIRFLISLSAVSALAFGVLCVSAKSLDSNGVVTFNSSRPQLVGNDFYVELITEKGWSFYVYGIAKKIVDSSADYGVSFSAYVSSDNYLVIEGFPSITDKTSFYIAAYTVDESATSALTLNNYKSNYNTTCRDLSVAGKIVGIHGYNCDVSAIKDTNTQFTFTYGSESVQYKFFQDAFSTQKSQLDKILNAIENNKSSAEKSEYSTTTDSQKQSQSDLDSAENKISSDTLEARNSTISIFKNFTLPGDIMKGLLTVTSLFNALVARLPFAPIVLEFSLAVGAAAFLLGLSAWAIGKFGRSRS